MRYMGSKARIGAELARVIGKANAVYEPFVGGGNMTVHLARNFHTVYASDSDLDLILMWQALLDGWLPPTEVSEELYRELRHAEPSALRGFAKYGCSFGGKPWGGYARGKTAKGEPRNYAGESRRNLLKKVPQLSNVTFAHHSFERTPNVPDSVYYLDPPYKGTTGYGGGFDYSGFIEWIDSLKGDIFLSEYEAPDDSWEELWSAPLRKSVGQANNRPIATERLFLKRRTKCSSK